jgi:hypothetical protein
LSAGYGADLDSLAPDWNTQPNGLPNRGIWYSGVALLGDIAVVSVPLNYDTCLQATGYADKVLPTVGEELCIRTPGKRHAAATVTAWGGLNTLPNQVVFTITVWNN